MIVRDEEANIPPCLDSASGLADELIIVDTGSSDESREVAAGFGARVFDLPWPDDFSAARNESLSRATGDWILWLDADDRLDALNREKLRSLLRTLPDELAGYLVSYVTVAEVGVGQSTADHVQLFRRHPEVRWRYRVHEQIAPAIQRAGGRLYCTDIVLHTVGYQDEAGVRRKLERNLRLLRLDHADHPNDPVVTFNLGRTLLRLDGPEPAAPLLQRSVRELAPSDGPLLARAYALLAEALGRLGRLREAIAAAGEGRQRLGEIPELLLAEGIFRANAGDGPGAEACLLAVIARDPAHAQANFHLARVRAARPFFQFNVGF